MKSLGYALIAITAGIIWLNTLEKSVADAVYESQFYWLVIAGFAALFAGVAKR